MTDGAGAGHGGREVIPWDERLRLVELVDRVLDKGVVLRGDVTIGVAGIDLIYLELRLLLAGVESLDRRRGGRDAGSTDTMPPPPDRPGGPSRE